MQYNVKTPEEYLDQLDSDWRKEKLEQVREIISRNDSSLDESIEYKMLAFQSDGKSVFHLNAQRNYVSLYVGKIDSIEGAAELLKDFDRGKGCIRIKKRVDLADSGLEEFIQRIIHRYHQGGHANC